MFQINPLLKTDSYKASHFLQYPPCTQYVTSYIEPRKNKTGTVDEVVFFGLQAFLKDLKPITADDVAFAKSFFTAHGLPFNENGWSRIVDVHDGRLPIRIDALLQGVNRDTLGYAMKANNVVINRVSHPVSKNPKTDPGKSSKAGIQAVIKENGALKAIHLGDLGEQTNYLFPKFFEGVCLNDATFAEIRERAQV